MSARATRFLSLIPVISVVLMATGCGSTETATGEEAAKVREAPICVTQEDADRMADQVLQLVNLERTAAGMPPITMHDTLATVAGDYACRMIEDGFFGHWDAFTGDGPADRAATRKYRFLLVGENLAVGQKTAAEVMKEWMASEAHHDMILNPKWTEVGIAVRAGGEHSIYWVQLFGQPVSGF